MRSHAYMYLTKIVYLYYCNQYSSLENVVSIATSHGLEYRGSISGRLYLFATVSDILGTTQPRGKDAGA